MKNICPSVGISNEYDDLGDIQVTVQSYQWWESRNTETEPSLDPGATPPWAAIDPGRVHLPSQQVTSFSSSTEESKTDLLCALSLISPLEEMGCREWSGDNCARIRQPNFSRPEEMNRIQPINVYEGSTCPVL